MILSKDKIQLNIKKAMGTLAKVQKMIDDDVYCADVAHQINDLWDCYRVPIVNFSKIISLVVEQRLFHLNEKKKKTLSKNSFGLGMLLPENNLPFSHLIRILSIKCSFSIRNSSASS
jgi:hypothetical protein